MRDQFVLGDAELERELLLMTDCYVDELFALPGAEAVTVGHDVSRLVLDPERFGDDADEPMAGVGMGAVYTAPGEKLPDFDDVAASVREAVRCLAGAGRAAAGGAAARP